MWTTHSLAVNVGGCSSGWTKHSGCFGWFKVNVDRGQAMALWCEWQPSGWQQLNYRHGHKAWGHELGSLTLFVISTFHLGNKSWLMWKMPLIMNYWILFNASPEDNIGCLFITRHILYSLLSVELGKWKLKPSWPFVLWCGLYSTSFFPVSFPENKTKQKFQVWKQPKLHNK